MMYHSMIISRNINYLISYQVLCCIMSDSKVGTTKFAYDKCDEDWSHCSILRLKLILRLNLILHPKVDKDTTKLAYMRAAMTSLAYVHGITFSFMKVLILYFFISYTLFCWNWFTIESIKFWEGKYYCANLVDLGIFWKNNLNQIKKIKSSSNYKFYRVLVAKSSCWQSFQQ